VWARSGRELFYLDTSSRRLTVVPVDTTQASFVFQPGAELFDVGGYPLFVGRGYDVAPDGQRFLFIRPDSAGATGDAPPPQVVIVEHFLDDVKRLVPTK
jgi:hypothetical protein